MVEKNRIKIKFAYKKKFVQTFKNQCSNDKNYKTYTDFIKEKMLDYINNN